MVPEWHPTLVQDLFWEYQNGTRMTPGLVSCGSNRPSCFLPFPYFPILSFRPHETTTVDHTKTSPRIRKYMQNTIVYKYNTHYIDYIEVCNASAHEVCHASVKLRQRIDYVSINVWFYIDHLTIIQWAYINHLSMMYSPYSISIKLTCVNLKVFGTALSNF